MAITDLLDRIPFPTRSGAPPAAAPPARPFSVELPPAEPAGTRLGAAPLAEASGGTPDVPAMPAPERSASAPASEASAALGARPPMPSYAVAVVGGLTLLSLALAVALAMAAAGPEPAAAATPAAPPAAAPSRPAAVFSAEPAPIPIDLLTRLEDAGEEPLGVELTRLLDAVQHGFGQRSVQLDPTLRSYVYRMSSRFEWTPDTFRVAVTAPDPDLATARGVLLERLFSGATATGRLQVGTGVGPHALTLVTE